MKSRCSISDGAVAATISGFFSVYISRNDVAIGHNSGGIGRNSAANVAQ